MSWLNFFKSEEENFIIKERKINPLYILNDEYRNAYIKNGFVVIPKAVSDEAIEKVLAVYAQIKKMPGYFESDKLQTTIAYGLEAHTLAIDVVKAVSEDIFNQFLDANKCIYDFGGGIIVKNKGCWFAPHQDCSIIDEYTGTTSYAWMPTVDMTDQNGTFFAIPGSHLWAAWQRSSQYPSWPLKKFSKYLWSKMMPIQVNKGDVLLFDSALIHASGDNYTNEERIAFNACIIEKEAQHVQYVQDKKTPKGKVEKYYVDLAYWFKGNLWGRPENYDCKVEEIIYPKNITKSFLDKQIEKYNQN